LVDEYQDTIAAVLNPAGIKADGHGLTVVGDDAHRSIRSAPRPFATFWISPSSFIPPQRSSRSIAIIAPRSRCSPPPMA